MPLPTPTTRPAASRSQTVTKFPAVAATFLELGSFSQLSPRAAPLGTLIGVPATMYIWTVPVAPVMVRVLLPPEGAAAVTTRAAGEPL